MRDSIQSKNHASLPEKIDYLIALAITLIALAAYIRTLAPDVLYSDSAEFQTLVYTFGYTHSTGYPIYLILGRIVGLLPFGSLAWRVNLFSALSASLTLGLLFLIIRYMTHSRWGASLACLGLGISYTFWSQAVIAEVYTPGMMVSAMIILLLLQWQRQPDRLTHLIFAALLAGVGLGVHASVGFLAIPALLMVLIVIIEHRTEFPFIRKIFLAGTLATLGGVLLLGLGFLLVDSINPASSFVNVMLYPSRSIWGLDVADLDSFWERSYLTFSGVQWQDAMFPASLDFGAEVYQFVERASTNEFALMYLFFSLVGLIWLPIRYFRYGLLVWAGFLTSCYFVLHYKPPDQYIFYLPCYLYLAIAFGVGIGFSLEWLHEKLSKKSVLRMAIQIITIVLLANWITNPFWETCWQALQAGRATFSYEEYVFPVKTPAEPRALATMLVTQMPNDAVLVMDWRALYACFYIAHVEGIRPGLRIVEATPHGSDGNLADSLVEMISDELAKGTPVYIDNIYGDLQNHFVADRVVSSRLYRLYSK